MKLPTIIPLVATAAAFADVAPAAAHGLSLGLGNSVSAETFAKAVYEASERLCEQGTPLTVYRAASAAILGPDLAVDDYVRHVHYPDASAVQLKLSTKCESRYVDTNELVGFSGPSVVQIVPTFGESAFEHAKKVVGDVIADFRGNKPNTHNVLIARDDNDYGVPGAVESIEEFVAAEKFDVVSEEVSDHEVGSGTAASGLFAHYQYFSPGLWSGIIVSLSLVAVLSVALSWITSLEISYKALDKQVDFEKKNE